jgi:hypothetical protein
MRKEEKRKRKKGKRKRKEEERKLRKDGEVGGGDKDS